MPFPPLHAGLRLLPAAFLALTLSACAGSSGQQAAPAGGASGAASPAGQAAPAVPRVVMGLVTPTDESNAVRLLGTPTKWTLRPMYEYLMGVDANNGKLVPQLATEWKVEEGNRVRFKLRQGVKFQKGNGELTAEDVVFSRNDLISADSTNAQKPYYIEVTKTLEAVNPYELLFTLNRPDANFLATHSEVEGAMEIQSKKMRDTRGDATATTEPTAGTGAYQFLERGQGTFLRFQRNPDYWGAKPDFPEFEFKWMKEASTRMAALLTGEIHLTNLPQDLEVQAEKQGMKLIGGKVAALRNTLRLYCCFLNDPKDTNSGIIDSPLNDVRVRRALDKAIDRDALNKAFFGGQGEKMLVPHFHPTRAGWNPDWEKRFQDEYGYDVNKAKSLLAEAGFGPGKPLTTNIFSTSTGGALGAEQDMLEAIIGYWKTVGVDVQYLQTDPAEITRLNRARRLSNHYYLRNTSSSHFTATWVFMTATFGSGTDTYVYEPEVERLFAQLRDTLDEAKQDPLYRQIGDVSFNKHLEIPLFWISPRIAVNPKIVGDYLYPGSITGTYTHVANIKAAK